MDTTTNRIKRENERATATLDTIKGMINRWELNRERSSMEKDSMIRNGYGTLYLCYEQEPRHAGYCGGFMPKNGKLTNCNGTFEIPITRIKRGRHNIAHCRYDVWFSWEGREWHGVTVGENTQICHIRALKSKA